ncbi:Uncharacterised protein [Mycobacteroides abscessus subsp. abscessus]|uniref:hypothetical protein n=1 Tax=Mycobacteroides abscessus TaxID=36809 RepID=UPI00092A22B4|nr:hypothetical protein [Mycobacteroides abscessus]SHS19221.1 Uncharacterised protein [Mycobacteroides abscessus subsp. abscessus]
MADIESVIRRLERAEEDLKEQQAQAKTGSPTWQPGEYLDIAEVRRLGGKIEGVQLALSYLKEAP